MNNNKIVKIDIESFEMQNDPVLDKIFMQRLKCHKQLIGTICNGLHR